MFPYGLRDFEFTRDLSLAESAPCDLYTVLGVVGRAAHIVHKVKTFVLVMAFRRDRPRRAARGACLACAVEVVEAVDMMVGIGPLGRRKDQVRDHSTDTHGLSLWRDEPVAEAKRAKTARVSSVALGKIGGKPHLGGMPMMYEMRRIGWGYGVVSFSFQKGDNMVSELDVERLSEITCVTPKQSRKLVRFSVGLAGIFADGENPGDHGKFLVGFARTKGQVKDLPGTEVKPSDNLLILLEEGVIRRGKSNKR